MVGPILKTLGKTIAKAAANKAVQTVAKEVAISFLSGAVGAAVEKIFKDKSMSLTKKLEELEKLKSNGSLTEEEYVKVRAKFIDSL
jgi:hypothetical protein